VSTFAAVASAQQVAKTDLYEDPLPQGAIARLGTSRLKVGNYAIGGLEFHS